MPGTRQWQPRECKRVRFLLLLLLCCAGLAVLAAPGRAVTVNPETQQLNNPADQTYAYIFAVLNNDPQPHTFTLKLDPWSEYLADQVSFSKEQFSLLPGQAENIQVQVHPRGLGPETHTLKVGVYDHDQLLATFAILVIVPGTPQEKYTVDVQAKDTNTANAVPVEITLHNYGNVIGYAQLALLVKRNDAVVGEVRYPAQIQVLPGQSPTFELVYTDTLEPGFYTAHVEAAYPSSVASADDRFSVALDASTQRIDEGTDLELTFASLGNPPAVTYRLLDADGTERATGTFLPTSGDIVVPTSELPAGDYTLTLSTSSGEQRILVKIRGESPWPRYTGILVAVCIVSYALITGRRHVALRWRLWTLERHVQRQQQEVTILINRAHQLVDAYSAAHARRRRASTTPGASGQGTG